MTLEPDAGRVLDRGEIAAWADLHYSNVLADDRIGGQAVEEEELLTFDLESATVALGIDVGVGSRTEVGVRVPFRAMSGGEK